MEKPSGCVICGAALVQPTTGRPRAYCGPAHRREGEYELRRAQSLLLNAEKAAMRARAAHEGEQWNKDKTRRVVKFWAAEVKRLEARLSALLADSPQETAKTRESRKSA